MSTAAVPGRYLVAQLILLDPADSGATLNPKVVVDHRGEIHHGRALEILSHAVEYLADSRMFLIDQPAAKANTEAASILMRLSREVFCQFTKAASDSHQLGRWISRKVNVLNN